MQLIRFINSFIKKRNPEVDEIQKPVKQKRRKPAHKDNKGEIFP